MDFLRLDTLNPKHSKQSIVPEASTLFVEVDPLLGLLLQGIHVHRARPEASWLSVDDLGVIGSQGIGYIGLRLRIQALGFLVDFLLKV